MPSKRIKLFNHNEIRRSLFGDEGTKSEKRVMQIIEAAIKGYSTVGVEETSFEMLAKTCKITRPLIHHYFKTKRDLFQTVIRYIRFRFQQLAIDAIQKETEPDKQLEAYINACFDWLEDYKEESYVWALFYYYCCIDKKMKALNSEVVNLGNDRIEQLIKSGVQKKLFRTKQVREKAKTIQVIITGALTSLSTENMPISTPHFRKEIVHTCLQLLKLPN